MKKCLIISCIMSLSVLFKVGTLMAASDGTRSEPVITEDFKTGDASQEVAVPRVIPTLEQEYVDDINPLGVDDSYEPNNTFANAYTGLSENTWLSDVDGLGIQADVDYYRIDITNPGSSTIEVECLFTDADGNIDLDVLNSSGFNQAVAWSETDNESLSFTAPSNGAYYVKVYWGNGANTYDLRWSVTFSEDLYEPNNSIANAYTGLQENVWLSDVEGLGFQNDEDLYRIDVTQPGFERVHVESLFTDADGDIDLALLDGAGNQLVWPWTTKDNEKIDFIVPSNGTYYVKVFWGNAGNAYDLRWSVSESLYTATYAPGINGIIPAANNGDNYELILAPDDPPPTSPVVQPDAGWVHVGWEYEAPFYMSLDYTLTALYEPLVSGYSGGSGTQADPYLIGSVQDFMSMAATSSDYDKEFLMTEDVYLDGIRFARAVIAPNAASGLTYVGTAFTGGFDGDGHVIYNIDITTSGANECFLGLFGKLDGAEVSRLGVLGINITDASGTSQYVGGFCGQSDGATINDCYVDDASLQVYKLAGGFCGLNSYDSSINNCFATAGVTCSDYAGGFCAYNYEDSSIDNSYAVGSIDCAGRKGGFCSYTQNGSTVDHSFWDTDVSALATSDGGTGKSTAEMQTLGTFTAAGWSFISTWYMDDYPLLASCTPVGFFRRWLSDAALAVTDQGENDAPAGDGVANLLKYASGLDASSPAVTSDLMYLPVEKTEGKFEVIFYQAKGLIDVSIEPSYATSLAGPWSLFGITLEVIGEDGDRDIIKASVPEADSGFIKLIAARRLIKVKL